MRLTRCVRTLAATLTVVAAACGPTPSSTSPDAGPVSLAELEGFWIDSAGSHGEGVVIYHSGETRYWDPWKIVFNEAAVSMTQPDCTRYTIADATVSLAQGRTLHADTAVVAAESSFLFPWDVASSAPFLQQLQLGFRDLHGTQFPGAAITVNWSANATATSANGLSLHLKIDYVDTQTSAALVTEERTLALARASPCP
jgi:hypothetical protein